WDHDARSRDWRIGGSARMYVRHRRGNLGRSDSRQRNGWRLGAYGRRSGRHRQDHAGLRLDREERMRAALYDRYGTASDVIRVTDIDQPQPGPGEVRVRMQLSGVNPTDWKSRSGATPRPIDVFQIPHHDGAGVIDAVGEGVPTDRVGQRVW